MSKNIRTEIKFSASVINALNEKLHSIHTAEVSDSISMQYNVYSLSVVLYDNGDEIVDANFKTKGQICEISSLDLGLDVCDGRKYEVRSSKDALAKVRKIYWNVYSSFCAVLLGYISVSPSGPVFDEKSFFSHLEGKN